ncbi:hypothetical protein BKH46_04830 [Helicobacter sp. 12S02634-8]|uniref:GNAT family N-acetyltransferase n=1 Tax=Helicobacter sp. 12S02634-8 TaxID=1476199 RepID=UPI000BA641EF|nr:GNAT family N-acetyltransferase [Helicobacter sp. 12S02634-8]PAF47048.1 hypothetical protein BKH46_04830 [Helicobacter sp. 12S02634-8]
MKPLDIHTINAYQSKAQAAKQGFYTNYIAPFGANKSTHKECDDKIYGIELSDGYVFLKDFENFSKLYFLTPHLCDLKAALDKLDRENICLEIIQRGALAKELQEVLCAYFAPHSLYEKLTISTKNLKLKLKNHPYTPQHAQLTDLDYLCQSLKSNFDARFDHLPSPSELTHYITNQQVLIQRDTNGEIIAYCIYQIDGKTSHFNYLLNLKADPFCLIALMESYYAELKHKGIQHIYLWVDIRNNLRVKNMHTRYGYQSSHIFNHTFTHINTKEIS